jgi:hypothetical protein
MAFLKPAQNCVAGYGWLPGPPAPTSGPPPSAWCVGLSSGVEVLGLELGAWRKEKRPDSNDAYRSATRIIAKSLGKMACVHRV